MLLLSLFACGFSRTDERIYEAVARGRVSEVQVLVSDDPHRASERDAFGTTPLHWACVLGQSEAGAALLVPGVAVNLADDDGVTPLMECARHCTTAGHVQLVRALLSAGADPSRRSSPSGKKLPWRLEMSALEMAAAVPAPDCVAELQSAKPHVWSSVRRQVEEAMAPALQHVDIAALQAAVVAAREAKLSQHMRHLAEARLALARREQAPLARWLATQKRLLSSLIVPREQSVLWDELEAAVRDSGELAAMPHATCVAMLRKHTAKQKTREAQGATNANVSKAASLMQAAAAADAEARLLRVSLEPRLQRLLLQVGRLWTKASLAQLVTGLGAALLDEKVRTVTELARLETGRLVEVVAQLRLSEASETTSDGLPSERRLGNDDAARVLAEQLQRQAMAQVDRDEGIAPATGRRHPQPHQEL